MGEKSRGNWNLPECVKFDCAVRGRHACGGCLRFSNYRKVTDQCLSPTPRGEPAGSSSVEDSPTSGSVNGFSCFNCEMIYKYSGIWLCAKRGHTERALDAEPCLGFVWDGIEWD